MLALRRRSRWRFLVLVFLVWRSSGEYESGCRSSVVTSQFVTPGR